MRRRSVVPLILLLFVVVRLALLFTSDRLGHFKEERQGNLAVQLLESRPLELVHYRYYDYEGSALVGSLWNVPFYAVLGPSGTTLKLAQIVLSVLFLWVLVAIARRAGGDDAAWVTGLLVTFAPPLFVHYTFDTIAGAYYGCMLNGLLLLSAIRAFIDEDRRWLPVWAFACGFGVFLHPSCLVGVVFTLALAAAHPRVLRPPRSGIVLVLPALVLGLIPLFLVGPGDHSSLAMVREAFIDRTMAENRTVMTSMGLGGKIWTMLTADLPHGLWQWAPPWAGMLQALLAAAAIAGVLVIARREVGTALGGGLGWGREGRALPAAVLPALFCLWYMLLLLVSDIQVPAPGRMVHYAKNYKFLLNVLPFVFLTGGIVASRAMRGRIAGRVVTLAALVVVLSLGARSFALEMSHGRPGIAPRYPSHDIAWLSSTMTQPCRLGGTLERCDSLPVHERHECIVGVGIVAARQTLGLERPGDDERDPASCSCEAVAGADRPLCVRGAGRELAWHHPFDIPAAAGHCERTGELAGECMLGYMEMAADLYHAMPDPELDAALSRMDDGTRDLLAGGMGRFYAMRFGRDPGFMLDRCDRMERRFGLRGCTPAALELLGREDALHEGRGNGLPDLSWMAGAERLRPDAIAADDLRAYMLGRGRMLAWMNGKVPGAAQQACRKHATPRQAEACMDGVRSWLATLPGPADPAAGECVALAGSEGLTPASSSLP